MDRVLTQRQARELIERAIAGEPRKALAHDFKVSYSTVSQILSGRAYEKAAPELLDKVRRWPDKKKQREIGVYIAAGGTRRDAARIFGVCEATVTKYARKFRDETINHPQRGKTDGEEGARAARNF